MNNTWISIVVLSFLILFFQSCDKTPCPSITCENRGTLIFDTDDCFCQCRVGYQGEFCDTSLAPNLGGSWLVTSCDSLVNGSYSAITSLSTDTVLSLSSIHWYSCRNIPLTLHLDGASLNIDSTEVMCGADSTLLLYGTGSADYQTPEITINAKYSLQTADSTYTGSCVYNLKQN